MKQHRRRPTVVRYLAAAAAAALVVTACGADEEVPEADPGAEAAEDPGEDPGEAAAANGECEDWLDGRTGDFVVPYNPGGSTDPVGREYATALENHLGQQWAVDNVAGGGATIGTSQILAGPADGSSLGLSSNTALAFQPLVNPDVPYDDADDYTMIMKLVDLPAVLTVRADAPWETIEEFLEAAEASPGELTVSTSGNLTQPDQNILILNEEAGVELRNVPFSGGGGEALTALLGGQVDANMGYGPSILGQVEAGEIRPLGVVGDQEYHLFPDATPFGDLGFDVATPAWYGIVAPAGMDADLVECIRELSMEAFTTPEIEEWAVSMGYNYDPVAGADAEAELATYADEYQRVLQEYGDLLDAPLAELEEEDEEEG